MLLLSGEGGVGKVRLSVETTEGSLGVAAASAVAAIRAHGRTAVLSVDEIFPVADTGIACSDWAPTTA